MRILEGTIPKFQAIKLEAMKKEVGCLYQYAGACRSARGNGMFNAEKLYSAGVLNIDALMHEVLSVVDLDVLLEHCGVTSLKDGLESLGVLGKLKAN